MTRKYFILKTHIADHFPYFLFWWYKILRYFWKVDIIHINTHARTHIYTHALTHSLTHEHTNMYDMLNDIP